MTTSFVKAPEVVDHNILKYNSLVKQISESEPKVEQSKVLVEMGCLFEKWIELKNLSLANRKNCQDGFKTLVANVEMCQHSIKPSLSLIHLTSLKDSSPPRISEQRLTS
jgi:hypothetical protein